MRIPFASILFVASAYILYLLSQSKDTPYSLFGMAAAILCICVMVCSMVLFANLDIPAYKH